ncbi:hypothetical protein [Rhizobium rhizogenes]|uniref:hypothetical protein n=1 Tax=Rhizobium rhizogenes TaxID=359 RepID=UPI001F3E2745|nr:hypothetical protein [Rhizobium rhizogenes]
MRDVVWLTTDERHEGHGLTTGEQLDPVHRSYVEKVEQTKLRQGRVWTADKTRIRIKVKIPTRDRKLFNYSAWSRKNDGPRFAKFMGLSCVESVAGERFGAGKSDVDDSDERRDLVSLVPAHRS